MSDVTKAHEVVWEGFGVRVGERQEAAPVAKDCLFILPGVSVRGVEKARPYFTAYLGAYPDTTKRVQHIVQDERSVVIRSTVTGHDTGSLVTSTARSEPTGQEVEWDIVEWLTVENGVIVEWRVYQDATPFIDVLSNLGADAERRAKQASARQPCINEVVTSTRFESPVAGS